MACDCCNGTGLMLFLNVWAMGKDHGKESKPLADYVMEGAPCPECRSEDFWGFLSAKIDKEGQPFTDSEIDTVGSWVLPDGRTVIVPVTGEE